MIGGGGHLGIGAMIVLGVIARLCARHRPRVLIGSAEMLNNVTSSGRQRRQQQVSRQRTTKPTDQVRPSSRGAILGQNEDVWSEVLPKQKNIRFNSAAGAVQRRDRFRLRHGAIGDGPFYCPLDKKIYLDTSFFRDMQKRFGGGGDFAYAYVISHEMGHHIEDQLGVLEKGAARAAASPARPTPTPPSVRIELMADCLAGVWAAMPTPNGTTSTRATSRRRWRPLRRSATTACNRRRAAGRAGFLHARLFGTTRPKWLKRGLQSGQIDSCNTFQR